MASLILLRTEIYHNFCTCAKPQKSVLYSDAVNPEYVSAPAINNTFSLAHATPKTNNNKRLALYSARKDNTHMSRK